MRIAFAHAFQLRGAAMSTFVSFVSAISNANPLVLVTVISVVALLVVAECVRQFCRAISKGDD